MLRNLFLIIVPIQSALDRSQEETEAERKRGRKLNVILNAHYVHLCL